MIVFVIVVVAVGVFAVTSRGGVIYVDVSGCEVIAVATVFPNNGVADTGLDAIVATWYFMHDTRIPAPHQMNPLSKSSYSISRKMKD